jgi:DNA replication protein DnaC
MDPWDRIFKDTMTTAGAIDRLVHHSVIIELIGVSYRVGHETLNGDTDPPKEMAERRKRSRNDK